MELLESPSRELDNDIVAVRIVLIEGAVLAAGDLIKSETACEHRGYECYRESCRLGSKSGGSGCTGVDLDNDCSVRYRIVCELAVAAADDFDSLDYLI